MRKQLRVVVVSMLAFAAIAWAGSIKVWTSGETLRSSDLNDNFTHIHNTMVGGHGARLVNADVAANAAIAASKVVGLTDAIDAGVVLSAQLPLVPKIVGAFGTTNINTPCSANPCADFVEIPASSIAVAWAGTGLYTVTFTARSNINYVVLISANNSAGFVTCTANDYTVSNFDVTCFDAAGGAKDAAVQFALIDNDAS